MWTAIESSHTQSHNQQQQFHHHRLDEGKKIEEEVSLAVPLLLPTVFRIWWNALEPETTHDFSIHFVAFHAQGADSCAITAMVPPPFIFRRGG